MARYDAFAQRYDEWIPDPNDDPVAQSLLRLTGDIAGQRILDLGCGQGRIARHLIDLGAAEVVGVELSAEMLAHAGDIPNVAYVHGDATTSAWWDGRAFDGVVSSMALMDIDDLAGAVLNNRNGAQTGRVVQLVHQPSGLPGHRTGAVQLADRGLLLRRGTVVHRRGRRPGDRRGEPPDPVDVLQRAL